MTKQTWQRWWEDMRYLRREARRLKQMRQCRIRTRMCSSSGFEFSIGAQSMNRDEFLACLGDQDNPWQPKISPLARAS